MEMDGHPGATRRNPRNPQMDGSLCIPGSGCHLQPVGYPAVIYSALGLQMTAG